MSSRRRCGNSSSGEEDEDEDSKRPLMILFTLATLLPLPSAKPQLMSISQPPRIEDELDCKSQTQLPKHYQLKLLADILENNSVMVRDGSLILARQEMNVVLDCLRRLHPGSCLTSSEPEGLKKKPRILPDYEIDEKSKEFRWKICCGVIDISDVVITAADACKKSIARMEAKDAAAKAAANRERTKGC